MPHSFFVAYCEKNVNFCENNTKKTKNLHFLKNLFIFFIIFCKTCISRLSAIETYLAKSNDRNNQIFNVSKIFLVLFLTYKG